MATRELDVDEGGLTIVYGIYCRTNNESEYDGGLYTICLDAAVAESACDHFNNNEPDMFGQYEIYTVRPLVVTE